MISYNFSPAVLGGEIDGTSSFVDVLRKSVASR